MPSTLLNAYQPPSGPPLEGVLPRIWRQDPAHAIPSAQFLDVIDASVRGARASSHHQELLCQLHDAPTASPKRPETLNFKNITPEQQWIIKLWHRGEWSRLWRAMEAIAKETGEGVNFLLRGRYSVLHLAATHPFPAGSHAGRTADPSVQSQGQRRTHPVALRSEQQPITHTRHATARRRLS